MAIGKHSDGGLVVVSYDTIGYPSLNDSRVGSRWSWEVTVDNLGGHGTERGYCLGVPDKGLCLDDFVCLGCSMLVNIKEEERAERYICVNGRGGSYLLPRE